MRPGHVQGADLRLAIGIEDPQGPVKVASRQARAVGREAQGEACRAVAPDLQLPDVRCNVDGLDAVEDRVPEMSASVMARRGGLHELCRAPLRHRVSHRRALRLHGHPRAPDDLGRFHHRGPGDAQARHGLRTDDRRFPQLRLAHVRGLAHAEDVEEVQALLPLPLPHLSREGQLLDFRLVLQVSPTWVVGHPFRRHLDDGVELEEVYGLGWLRASGTIEQRLQLQLRNIAVGAAADLLEGLNSLLEVDLPVLVAIEFVEGVGPTGARGAQSSETTRRVEQRGRRRASRRRPKPVAGGGAGGRQLRFLQQWQETLRAGDVVHF
mmetsp:Transcript_47115/g.135741  ORF Transcript_47115/g.135741 Transcript_47115/m.135741 type:complete len:323 (-) Transcript_47115:261-1229(-)